VTIYVKFFISRISNNCECCFRIIYSRRLSNDIILNDKFFKYPMHYSIKLFCFSFMTAKCYISELNNIFSLFLSFLYVTCFYPITDEKKTFSFLFFSSLENLRLSEESGKQVPSTSHILRISTR
jgi:hypothetical protein